LRFFSHDQLLNIESACEAGLAPISSLGYIGIVRR